MSHKIQPENNTNSSAIPISAIPLVDRAVIGVEGDDAASFLHNLLTASITTLSPREGTLAALLTPQGKIITDMLVFNASKEGEARFLIDCAACFVEDVMKRLTLYKLRAKVSITRLAQDQVLVLIGESAKPTGQRDCFADPRHPTLGLRCYGGGASLENAASGGRPEDYHARRIALGIPESGRDYAPNTLFPHEANLDQLGGVDFKKGCYVGQEVVSRMEHRGLARTRAMICQFENGLNLLDGAEVMAGESRLGFIGQSCGGSAIGFLRLDRAEEALKSGTPLIAGGLALQLKKPVYARF